MPPSPQTSFSARAASEASCFPFPQKLERGRIWAILHSSYSSSPTKLEPLGKKGGDDDVGLRRRQISGGNEDEKGGRVEREAGKPLLSLTKGEEDETTRREKQETWASHVAFILMFRFIQ